MLKHKPSSSGQSGEPKAKKTRIKSSRSDENEEGEEEELFNQSQNPDLTAPFEESEADYGIIEKISVKNFMCYGRLDCNFGPNVNFVVGRNGSGKSAILTAIVVGLGGKAIATSRGHSVKDFIKAGKSVAEICIKLRNRGDDAYKPDVYGSSITVMRRIRKDGMSYKLMSAKGKVVSTKKEELSHIMDHFNIQVDNPVSIMNQETSRNFLQKQSAKDKYKFFLKAIQLEQVSNYYREIKYHKEVTEKSLNAQSARLPILWREVSELKQKFKALIRLQDLTNKRQELMKQLAWAQVAELEKERDSKRNEIQREENREPKFIEKIQQQEDKVKEAEEKHAQIQSQAEALRQRLEDLSPQHDTAKDNVQKLKRTVKALERKIRQITTQIRSQESYKNDILKRIQDEKERDQAQFEEERLERERRVTALFEEKRDLESQRQNAAREIDQFANAVNSAREQTYDLQETRREISDNQKAQNEIKQKVQSLRQVVSDNENLRKTAQRQKIKLEDRIGKINNQITQLEAEGEGEEETNVADLEEEVQQMEANINERKEKLERFSKNFKEAHRQLVEAEGQFKMVDDQVQEISYQDDLAGASIEVQTAKQHRKHYEEKKKELMAKIADLKKEAEAIQKRVEEAISKAMQIYPKRLKVVRKVSNIDKEIKQISKKILKEQNMQGDPVEITRQYDEARKNYKTVRKQIRNMKRFVEKMNTILNQRYVALKDMRHFIAHRTKYYFMSMMSTRGYVGQLKFDHPKEELILTVDPGESQKTKDVSKDVRSLSGGERSFSTVCLIMALWESVESPFRAIDEFDVFMDMMNRKICIESMLQFAKDQANRQFIFLTPQDMSKISPSQFVHVIRLHDPERNQGYITAEPPAATQADETMEEDE